jgi:hypothetical protein
MRAWLRNVLERLNAAIDKRLGSMFDVELPGDE